MNNTWVHMCFWSQRLELLPLEVSGCSRCSAVRPATATEIEMNKGRALRYNDNKARLDLVPLEIVQQVADVFGFGAQKYGEYNWTKGFDWLNPFASTMRHLVAWQSGKDEDEESKLPHLAHAICNLMMILYFQKHGIGKDNRWLKKS